MAARFNKGNPVYQNRTLEGEEGLKQSYSHKGVIAINEDRAAYIHDENGQLVKK
jgi:hypothetical protein